jgi:beta-galactosidase
MGVLQIKGNDFTIDGHPLRLLSGAMHYFRVMPEYWRDRMLRLKAMGLNTLETYVAWNLHEPKPGQFNFEGRLDLARYVRLAGELGLMVIVRPGPYMCSEWDLGGLPAWLLADPNMQLRCNYGPYLQAADRFFDALLPQIVPLQATHGGPIIAMQVENEYGSYGNDKTYLRHLRDGMVRRGVDVLLFTSDGPTDLMLVGGTLPDLHKVGNFGSRAKEQFAKLREHQPTGPLMCGEFWNGWFDHWGKEHHYRDPKDAAAALDEILAADASVNLYMFHGGTNFGFMAGANYDNNQYFCTTGSYDDGAPVDECGQLTPKYFAFRDVIGKYAPLPELPEFPPAPLQAFGQVKLTRQATLFGALDVLSRPVHSPAPVPMEMLGQNHGFILYRTTVRGPGEKNLLDIRDVRDRALVFLDGQYCGLVYRNNPDGVALPLTDNKEHQLDILVENCGRINFGHMLHDRKGITHGVRLDWQHLYDWTIFPLPLEDLASLRYQPIGAWGGPAFYSGTFEVDQPADTFLRLPGWTKGVAYLNGFNLGRYWEIGPQQTLYIPAPLLKRGTNQLVIFELHGMKEPAVELLDHPVFETPKAPSST